MVLVESMLTKAYQPERVVDGGRDKAKAKARRATRAGAAGGRPAPRAASLIIGLDADEASSGIENTDIAVPWPAAAETAPKPKPAAAWCSTYSRPEDAPRAGSEIASTTLIETDSLFHIRPEAVLEDPSVPYIHVPQPVGGAPRIDAATILAKTPLPKGATEFSSLHVVVAPGDGASADGDSIVRSAQACGKEPVRYSWPALQANDCTGEYDALFSLASDLILKGADRASLLVFIANDGGSQEMAIASILGMLPFRGVQTAFVTPNEKYVDPLACLRTPSGLLEYTASQPERMGRRPLAAVFGPLPSCTFSCALATWSPLKPVPVLEEKPAPFKIGAMELPMTTYEGRYEAGVARLTELLVGHFGASLFPVVASGETVDALGYGHDIHMALEEEGCSGHYFVHKSTETYKRPDAYGKPELLEAISKAKLSGRQVVIIAVGGGVNGNAMGMIAALTGAAFVEVPTTLMHYNDATTSAKKAFSLVVDGQILSKNILGTFYLPQLVFCISEVFLTLSSNSVHAAVGEAAKTMSMLGKANTSVGQQDFHNILGASEFSSDFTRIISNATGFEKLVAFLQSTSQRKDAATSAGRALRQAKPVHGASELLAKQRKEHLAALRAQFYTCLSDTDRREVMAFMTAINEEVIKAKAMFLAYSDPFEKYRALLFEYAHTLGHGIEAFMNGLYEKAEAMGIDCTDAFRLHGQCVGMAVLLAGEMSREMGHLEGDGFLAHQSFVYLFNRFGGFDFLPLRRLCDKLGVQKPEFCEGVLRVVRRDNKRGYCRCAPGSSVDQLVRARPGCLLRSSDPSAELRYLVEVSENSQRQVLERAFEGDYDKVLVYSGKSADEDRGSVVDRSGLTFVARANFHAGSNFPEMAAKALDLLLQRLYGHTDAK